MRWRAGVLVLATTVLTASSTASGQTNSNAFTFTKIAEGVYHAMGTGRLPVGGNIIVIVNEQDVMLVDASISPTAARALLRELAEITTKPVKYLVNTHFHFDHTNGNQVFGAGVEIIGHEFTRDQIASGKFRSGVAWGVFSNMTGVRVDDVMPTAPTLALSHDMTLFRGSREIRLMNFGRGHTGGDVVVYLPAERIIITGDLYGGRRVAPDSGYNLPFLGDGYLDEWAEIVGKVGALEWDVMLPGHGPPIRDRAMTAKLRAVLAEFHRQGTALLNQGFSVSDAEARMDLSAYAADFPALVNHAGVREWITIGLTRMRELRSKQP